MAAMFRLMDLPLITIERVISQLRVLDIFDFSLCSKKCENIVKSSHRLPKVRLEIDLMRGMPHLQFSNEKSDKLMGFLMLDPLIEMPTADRKIEGRLVKLWKDESSEWSTVVEDASAEVKNILIDRFVFLFGRDRVLYQLTLDFNTDLPNIATLVDSFDICERLITFGTIPDEILDLLISKLTFTKLLKLNENSGINFEPTRPLQLVADEVYMEKCWIKPEQFLNSDCSRMHIRQCEFPDSVFQQFISQWFETGNTRLQYAVARGQSISADPLNLDVFGECRRWDPTVRSQYYPVKETDVLFNMERVVLDLSNGVDIIREDGLLVTVLKRRRLFMFVVWHERFPQLPQNPEIF